MQPHKPVPTQADPWLVILSGGAAILGAVTLVVGTIAAGLTVENYDPIADTISDLAAGQHEWIMDVSLHVYAAGLIGLAIASADRRLDGARWTAGVLMIALLGLCVTIIATRNEYGDNDSGGVVVHIYLVYLLGVLYAAAPLALRRGLARTHRGPAWVSVITAAIWIVAGPLFFLVPTSIDGLVERLLGVVAAVWTGSVAYTLIRSAVAAERRESIA